MVNFTSFSKWIVVMGSFVLSSCTVLHVRGDGDFIRFTSANHGQMMVWVLAVRADKYSIKSWGDKQDHIRSIENGSVVGFKPGEGPGGGGRAIFPDNEKRIPKTIEAEWRTEDGVIHQQTMTLELPSREEVIRRYGAPRSAWKRRWSIILIYKDDKIDYAWLLSDTSTWPKRAIVYEGDLEAIYDLLEPGEFETIPRYHAENEPPHVDTREEFEKKALRALQLGDRTPIRLIKSGGLGTAANKGINELHSIYIENLFQQEMRNVTVSRSDGKPELLSTSIPEFMTVMWETSDGDQQHRVPIKSRLPDGFTGRLTIYISKNKSYLNWTQVRQKDRKAIAWGGQIAPIIKLANNEYRRIWHLSTGSSFSLTVWNRTPSGNDIYNVVVYRPGFETHDSAKLGEPKIPEEVVVTWSIKEGAWIKKIVKLASQLPDKFWGDVDLIIEDDEVYVDWKRKRKGSTHIVDRGRQKRKK